MNRDVLHTYGGSGVTIWVDGIPSRSFSGQLDTSKLSDGLVVIHNAQGEPLHFPSKRIAMLAPAQP